MRRRIAHNLAGRRAARQAAVLLASLSIALMSGALPGDQHRLPVRSPYDAAYSPDGRTLAVTDRTAGSVAFFSPASRRSARTVALSEPTGLAWAQDGTRLYVAEYGGASVAEIDRNSGAVLRRLRVAPRPISVAVCASRRLLIVPCEALHTVSIVDLASGRERARLACPGQPFGVAVIPGANLAAVGNLTPGRRADDPANSSEVTLIDLKTLRIAGRIRLPAGSNNLRGVCASPDGRWIYVAHCVAHFNLPTTQLDRGWVSTNALSILDARKRAVHATVLLDTLVEGAADPWGIAISPDGSTLWVSLSGVHQLARIELARLHRYLAGDIPPSSPLLSPSPEYMASSSNPWAEIRRDPARRDLLATDLTALSAAELLTRMPLPGLAPRGIALSPDGARLAVPVYFSGAVQIVDAATGRYLAKLSMGPSRPPDRIRTGERMFHDATLCFQHWLSCATCHPDGRADGLNWDLLNDGIGNPKNTRSLLCADRRSPLMAQGVREGFRAAVVAGFRFIEFHEPQPGEVESVQAFLASMRPQPSPYRSATGLLTPGARRGKALFASRRTRCATCHRGPLWTDQLLHDVGTRGATDTTSRFVTPPLVEVWRTAPYLHDGRAATMREVLTTANRADRHGVTSHLTRQQIDDLAEYVLSL